LEPTDVTIEILKVIRDDVKRIRDEAKQTNARLDQTNARLDQTNARIDSMHDGLSRRIVESEVRTATAITDLSLTMREMTDVLRAQHDVRPRLDRCEHDITALKQHLGLE